MIDTSRVWTTEWIVIAFFAYLIVLARLRPMSGRQRGRVLLVGLVCASLALMLSQLRLSPILRVAREWLPAVYLIQGYWLSGLFFRRPMVDVEERLIDVDRWLFRVANATALAARPRVLRAHVSARLPFRSGQLRPLLVAWLSGGRRQLLDRNPDCQLRQLRRLAVDSDPTTP
jgi:hypothetical protein